jgi:hypothetical protein
MPDARHAKTSNGGEDRFRSECVALGHVRNVSSGYDCPHARGECCQPWLASRLTLHDDTYPLHPQSLKRVRQSPPFKGMTDHEAARCLRGGSSVGADVKLSAQLALFYAMAVSVHASLRRLTRGTGPILRLPVTADLKS